MVFHSLIASPRFWKNAPLTWILVEVVIVTAITAIADAAATSVVVIYPVLIIQAGVWFRARLVWLATFATMISYAALSLEHLARKGVDPNDHPGLVLVSLAVLGGTLAMIVRQIPAREQKAPIPLKSGSIRQST